jgi:hypothetical protein
VRQVYSPRLYLCNALIHPFLVKKLSLLLLAALALGSCKKNDETAPTPAAPSKTDLLTAKNWRPTTASITVTVAGQSSSLGSLDACNADDYLKFSTDKSLVHDAGATKCDPTDPQTEKGTWDMPSDGKLTVTLPASSTLPIDGTFDVKELTATDMHLSSTQTQSGGSYTIDVTMKSF